ncbi:hypothetical protein T02_1322 [Trichinella nativa]|uniref:Uncharacterized protein n=1 Tax=Trichinella nativa TaxID=6335 RepID=A0A0V1KYX0_9BILA|nr:hypothetical protein T02_15559 [Trichinella nativa]KRZ52509.1 hypothetical protein T02_1322 [Trichinella nativa]
MFDKGICMKSCYSDIAPGNVPANRNIGDVQKYALNVQHVFLDKEGGGGAVWSDLEVPAGIDRKDHVENS